MGLQVDSEPGSSGRKESWINDPVVSISAEGANHLAEKCDSINNSIIWQKGKERAELTAFLKHHVEILYVHKRGEKDTDIGA